jgi:hypothetical protein
MVSEWTTILSVQRMRYWQWADDASYYCSLRLSASWSSRRLATPILSILALRGRTRLRRTQTMPLFASKVPWQPLALHPWWMPEMDPFSPENEAKVVHHLLLKLSAGGHESDLKSEAGPMNLSLLKLAHSSKAILRSIFNNQACCKSSRVKRNQGLLIPSVCWSPAKEA